MSLRPLLLSIASVSLLLAAGCRTVSGGSCHKPQPYEGAQAYPPLRVPTGLDGPKTDGALEIPVVNEPEAPVDTDGPCLDAPPAITAPPLPPSDVVVPDGSSRPRSSAAPQEGVEPPAGEEQDTERRRPNRRPR
jgi:hypothetical protein